MIKSVTYSAEQIGPKFLVFGAVHGNEKCGTIAINRIMEEIDSGKLKIMRGQVTFVPICNPRAYEQDVRYVERNLNRYVVPMEKPNCYEARLGNILCPMLASCDVHLSIHSYTVGGEPFTFIRPGDEKEQEFAASLGPYTLLTGWADAYARTGRKTKNAAPADDEEATGTVEYAHRHGAMAIDIECGQHRDPDAPGVAYNAIRNALRYLGMTDEPKLEAKVAAKPKLVTMSHVYYRDDEGKLARDWKHLETVKKDEPIAFRADGSPITAPDNGVIIMPKVNTPLGEEWFYFGQ
jgi:predicted deacylase